MIPEIVITAIGLIELLTSLFPLLRTKGYKLMSLCVAVCLLVICGVLQVVNQVASSLLMPTNLFSVLGYLAVLVLVTMQLSECSTTLRPFFPMIAICGGISWALYSVGVLGMMPYVTACALVVQSVFWITTCFFVLNEPLWKEWEDFKHEMVSFQAPRWTLIAMMSISTTVFSFFDANAGLMSRIASTWPSLLFLLNCMCVSAISWMPVVQEQQRNIRDSLLLQHFVRDDIGLPPEGTIKRTPSMSPRLPPRRSIQISL